MYVKQDNRMPAPDGAVWFDLSVQLDNGVWYSVSAVRTQHGNVAVHSMVKEGGQSVRRDAYKLRKQLVCAAKCFIEKQT